MLTHLARVILKIAVLRYVDDYFWAEHAETIAHAKDCFATVVRALLGEAAIAAHKLEHGLSLTILGLDMEATDTGVNCRPSQAKRVKWLKLIQGHAEASVLSFKASELQVEPTVEASFAVVAGGVADGIAAALDMA